jgi:transposase
MKHRLGVSYEKIAEMFGAVFKLRVSRSGLCRAGRGLAQKIRPVYEELKEGLRGSAGVHSDETGWRIGTVPAWLWALVSRRITLYTIRTSRGHEVVTDVLGEDFGGVLHSDCFSAYDSKELQHWAQQRCLAHLTRELSELEKSKTRGAVRFPRNVLAVLREAMDLGRRKAESFDVAHGPEPVEGLSAADFKQELQRIEERLDALISQRRRFTDPDNARIAKRLRKQRQRLFTFLTHPGAEPTNNRAERAIHPAVVARKMGGCSKTRTGTETHAILASVLATAKGLGIGTVDYLRCVATCRGSPPPLLAAAA